MIFPKQEKCVLARRAWKSRLQSKDGDHPLACLSPSYPGQNPDSVNVCQEGVSEQLYGRAECSPSEMKVLSPELTGVKAGGAALEGRSGWDMGD